MTKYLVIERQQYSENTPEYGCGDYPDQIEYILAVVEGDTLRKAQNPVKKIFPRVRFGGMFSPQMVPFTGTSEYIKAPDPRLWGKARERHLASMAALLLFA